MDKCDFIFRGETLQDHGYVMCDFNGGSSAGGVQTDSQRTFTSMSMRGGRRTPILYYTYDAGLVIQISICKDPDAADPFVSQYETVRLKRWLESPKPEVFRIVDEDYYNVFWEGTFNVEEYRFGGDILGFNLTFNSVAPWGYRDKVILSGTVSGTTGDTGETEATGNTGEEAIIIRDTSDEEGFIYPDIKLTVLEDGDLSITNSFDGRTTLITDCTQDEVIHMNHFLQISTSDANHAIYDCFNYKFVRIHNSYDTSENELTFSLPCEYEITYNPIAKAVFD